MAVGRLDCRDVHYQRGCFQYNQTSHNMRVPEKSESFALRVLVVTLLVVHLDALNEEGQCLLEFKRNLGDQFGKLKSWNATDENPCYWEGVNCINSASYPRVWSLDLGGMKLKGSLSPSISNLTSLRVLNVSSNILSGKIPPELGDCLQLEIFDVDSNRLRGEIPLQLGKLSSLRKLYLSNNRLVGNLPQEFGNLSSLVELRIHNNNITGALPSSFKNLKNLQYFRAGNNLLSGPIPPEISECDSLQFIGLAQNNFEGELPKELGRLQNLRTLRLWLNKISGSIPKELGNCSKLETIALYVNDLVGEIPEELGNLKNLRYLYLYANNFNGTIPWQLANCTSLTEIDLSSNLFTGFIPPELSRLQRLQLLYLFRNQFTGNIPRELGQLGNLRNLDLSNNQLSGSIPTEFRNLTNLESLVLSDNSLNGIIPLDIGIYSGLKVLDLSNNLLSGSIPSRVCKLGKLAVLNLRSNQLTGNIPYGVTTCKSLKQLRLGDNKLTGSLPVELCQLENLTILGLSENQFSGSIPPELGNLESLETHHLSNLVSHQPHKLGNRLKLTTLNISSNNLTGSIPLQLANFLKLERLDLSGNAFTGSVPNELGNLVHLELLKLSDNKLSGQIPGFLGRLSHLTEMQMGGNNFSGPIPPELGQLKALQIALNLSWNRLSREIPAELGNLNMLESIYLNNNQFVGQLPPSFANLLSLTVCNVSYNNLTGPLPNITIFRNMPVSCFIENQGLCGGPMPDACQPISERASIFPHFWQDMKNRTGKIVAIFAEVLGVSLLIILVVMNWFFRQPGCVLVSPEDKQSVGSVVYFLPIEGFTFQDLVKGTHNFSETTVIGRGACGTVYKATMHSGQFIAVKKMVSEMQGNDVENSFDSEISTLGNIRHRNIVKLYGFCYDHESKFLLYEYMPKGSLAELLHESQSVLDWDTRYKIALGAAEGISYLHHDRIPRIIHRDIKSNNILLDDNFEAHVGDFGLAKLIDVPFSMSMSAVAGSYGYIAPEYAYTMKITEKSDVYSFGVVLLELLTGRRPIQPVEDGGDLVTCVRSSIQTTPLTSGVFDDRLDLNQGRVVDSMVLVLKIALLCTSAIPSNRPTMRQVVSMLIDTKREINESSSPTEEKPLNEDKK